MTQLTFSKGDNVYHAKRPEWGPGVVDDAVPIDHEGAQAQRLTIRFANRGKVTLNSALAELVHKEPTTIMPSPSSSTQSPAAATPATKRTGEAGGWLGSLTKADPAKLLYTLPDRMNDPFISTSKRLENILETYKYSADPRNPRLLLDWACGQTGMADPLSVYSRQELEQAFPRFARDRDNLLFDLVRQLKRSGEASLLTEAMRTTKIPQAREALQRAMNR